MQELVVLLDWIPVRGGVLPSGFLVPRAPEPLSP